jgi:hypothetical protein
MQVNQANKGGFHFNPKLSFVNHNSVFSLSEVNLYPHTSLVTWPYKFYPGLFALCSTCITPIGCKLKKTGNERHSREDSHHVRPSQHNVARAVSSLKLAPCILRVQHGATSRHWQWLPLAFVIQSARPNSYNLNQKNRALAHVFQDVIILTSVTSLVLYLHFSIKSCKLPLLYN